MANKKMRAKFKDKREQIEYFRKVKSTLKMGSKKLSTKLGLKSRAMIENYSLGRTSPRMNILKLIEDLSGIKADYSIVEGHVVKKKRGMLPLHSEKAMEILTKKGVIPSIDKSIKEGKNIKQIENELRKQGLTFDTSKLGRAIGTYKKMMIIKESEKIDTSNCMILKGHVLDAKTTIKISFNLSPLNERLKNSKILIGYEIDEQRKNIKLSPLSKIGNRLFSSRNTITFQISKHLKMEHNSKINVILNVNDFKLNILDGIQDFDGKILAKNALSKEFNISKKRITSNSYSGDVVLEYKNKNIIVEITRSKSRQVSRFKIGQCAVAKVINENSFLFLVCYPDLFSDEEIKTLDWLNVFLIETNFEDNWDNLVINSIIERLENGKISN